MTLRVRQWRKRQRELDQLLCYSGSDEEGIENNGNSVSGTQSSFSSDGVPGTPDSLMSDGVLGTSDDFDFDTDVDYCSTDSEQEPNETEVTSFEDELRQWALEWPACHKKLVVLSLYPFAMVWNTHIKVMYTRAVWREGTQEKEGVVPDSRIDREMRTVRWPRKMSVTKTEKAIKDKINPHDDWMTFSLIKIKLTSDKRRECDTYNLTSQAEEDDEVIRSTRKRTKKVIPEGFVRNELTDSDESVRGVKLPTFPAAPRKLQPIEDTNMLHNTSHEDGAMSSVQTVQAVKCPLPTMKMEPCLAKWSVWTVPGAVKCPLLTL
ncbi:hypothetical protein G5714_004601 [Onychostoma macrolepis]|uniref:Uncharacterized protein n=1 Tax=Onychostoma macrolepis TaxID=369639 RepID=A0A7J6D539_9TELE|nr:hypothetical protein G5714_004601 [Onychostoma macrolepis]